MSLRPPGSTLFPYTTLFRSKCNKPRAVYSDLTWTAFVGKEVPDTYRDVFNIVARGRDAAIAKVRGDRKSTRLNSSHTVISYAVFCLKKKKKNKNKRDYHTTT